MTIQPNPNAAALMGALVADAATMGLHWIYDPARIVEVGGDGPAFTPPDAANFEGVPAYFAHGARASGDLSQYGEVLALAMKSIEDAGVFDAANYQDAYVAHFGPGGPYVGYIDRPTRGTLANISADQRAPSGVDDDQLPALAALPAIIAQSCGGADFHAQIKTALSVTHVNEAATHYALILADLLADVLSGTGLDAALKTAAKREPLLQSALDALEADSTAYGEITGRACHLYQGMPLAFHILTRTDNFSDAINANIRAGGDNCGRSIIIGSLAGAAYGVQDIPLDWLLQTSNAATYWSLGQKISTPRE